MSDDLSVDLIRNSLTYASEEMGIALKNTGYSPNIKERMDHSCAIFDATGRLIAQAEHIPVHLGSLPWGLANTLRYLKERNEELRNGDMVIVNDPYIVGTHLNDVTLIRPIFYTHTLVGYSANKAHHDDIGGFTPGSMSTSATDLLQEGLVIPPLRIMSLGKVRDEVVELIMKNSRTPKVREGDLRAQISANMTGERRVVGIIEKFGLEAVLASFDAILSKSEVLLRNEIARMGEGESGQAEDFLELPERRLAKLKVKVTVKGNGTLEVDYSGTGHEVSFPLNAVYGVTISGVYYVVRCLTDPSIPMNDGCFRPIAINIPKGTILNPNPPAPVSGGNVETSQRNVDVLFRAFSAILPSKVPAASQGTMNNVVLGGVANGRQRWILYETIGGGMGARPGMNGIDGIQVHMTNTMNTPIESIERYYPMMVMSYHFRDGTGGSGRFRGGDGIERSYKITAGKAKATILADRVRLRPWGLRGGKRGAPGKHSVLRKGGNTEELDGKCTVSLEKGDTLVIRTPGGGGFGKSKRGWRSAR